ncbi:MAG: bifunctional phosphopantothenoylcysteine decarboxylase/phosphopantothenate--cysteine ligase CoaBC, partial [Deltaproteobacteria bacterium]|nr:bifunctional phosphopantothenoylcysteine decarboxylase/phosphopantothenate--cysteine ligase CoaBC [Deltaproteobacteria bacterium]
EPVYTEMFDPTCPGERHVSLTADADVLALVPATAELIAALAQGRANDLLRAAALCARCPVVMAPAMHPRMWEQPATRRNVATVLGDNRVQMIGPVKGEVATGEVGVGRMAEPDEIAAKLLGFCLPQDLIGLRIVVSAGPTAEDIDPARYLTNRSSGKMGFAIAERAAARGAKVTLVAGPVALPTPPGVDRVDVRSALSMQKALWDVMGADLAHADALVMTAAVADYRPEERFEFKMKRAKVGKTMNLELVANPDLLAEFGAARTGERPVLVGFALETLVDDELVEAARGKLEAKGVDLVVANHAADAFDRDDNRATLVTPSSADALPRMPKSELADHVLDAIVASCSS